MSDSSMRSKKFLAGLAAVAVVGASVVGIALGNSAEANRSVLVHAETLGIAVPVSLTEQLDIEHATRIGDAYGDQTVFHAIGRGEYADLDCIFTAGSSGPTDVVPFVCDTAEVLRTTGLDVGVSTSDGGLEGVLVRGSDPSNLSAESYSVGPSGGRVVLSPGPGGDVVFNIPNLAELDARADREVSEMIRP